MSATLTTPKTTSGGEIITHLINSTDGTGLHFDGADGTYVNCGDTTILDGATKMSMEVIASTSATAIGFVIGKSYDSNCFLLRFEADGTLRTSINNGSSTATALSAAAYNDGNPKHIVVTWDNATVSIYVNGNLDGTNTLAGGSIPNTADKLGLGAYLKSDDTDSSNFNGTIYRARLWNKSLSQAEVTASYENATVPFADQWGVQTNKITASVDQTWSNSTPTNPTTFNAAYGWEMDASLTGVSVASNVLQFTTAGAVGMYLHTAIVAGKKFRITVATGAITGAAFKVYAGGASAAYEVGELVASTTNIFEFTAAAGANGYTYIYGTGTGTLQLNAASVSNEIVAAGVVSDYDLAFANPTQSLMVQDRAGAADGTSSATGVVQVTPIEQLNSKSARIGTTAATPADGDLLVSGKVGIGVGTPLALLHVQTSDVSVTPNVSADNLVVEENGNAGISIISGTSNTGNLTWGDTTADMAVISYSHSTNDMSFRVNSTNDVLTLDSAGNVGIGGSPSNLLHLKADDTAVTPQLKIEQDGTGDASLEFLLTGARNWNIGCDNSISGDPFVIGTGGSLNDSPKLTIDSAGQVGIGVNDPGAVLEVTKGTNALGLIRMTQRTSGNPAYGLDIGLDPSSFGAVFSGIHNDVVTRSFEIARDTGLATFANGIVETGGVLKSNLLTNSGFDVWSNSTLEAASTVLDETGSGAFSGATGGTPPSGWTDNGGSATYSVASGTLSITGADAQGCIISVPVVAGKLYRLRVTTGGSNPYVYAGSTYPSISTDYVFINTTTGAQEFVFEATTAVLGIYLRVNATTATFDELYVQEVTPGCVAAGAENVDGWQRRGGTATKCWRQHEDATLTKDGSFYSLKTTSTTSAWNHTWPDATLINDANFLARFAGRTVTAGCWVYSTLATPEIRLNLYTGTDNFSTQTVAQNTWTWLETTTTCPDALANFYFQLYKSGATSETYYVSQVCLVFGSAIGSGNYSRPSGEIVNCEKEIAIINNESPVAATDKIRNLESDSSGKIPKGAKAITVRGYIQSSAVSSGKGVHFGPDSTESYNFTQQPVVVNFYDQASGVINCDSNGDIYQVTSFTGSTASAHYMAAYQVQLR